jgi:hypothetical protein
MHMVVCGTATRAHNAKSGCWREGNDLGRAMRIDNISDDPHPAKMFRVQALLLSELGTCKTNTATFWLWLSGASRPHKT